MKLREIQNINLLQSTSYEKFYSSFKNYFLLSKKFKNFLVLLSKNQGWNTFVVIDAAKCIDPTEDRPIYHNLKNFKKVIPLESIVGGIDLKPSAMPLYNQTAYKSVYVALNPDYQGKGLAVDLYIWLLDNHPITGVGIIESDTYHSAGSKKLWVNLAKKCLVLAYDLYRKKYSVVDINDEDELEADFPIYNDLDLIKHIWQEHLDGIKELKNEYDNGKINDETYDKMIMKLKKQTDKALLDAGSPNETILFATKKLKKKP